MIFNLIIINYQSDLKKIKEEEEKVREELSKESENNENQILEGNEEIKINDPVEKPENENKEAKPNEKNFRQKDIKFKR